MAVTTLTDFTSNKTLTAGTYWMPYDINCNGYTLTFDCTSGPIIIKRAGDYSFAYLGSSTGTVLNTTNSTTTNKVYLTDKNDDTIGEAIAGSTGTPVKSGCSIVSLYSLAEGYQAGLVNCSTNFKNWEIRYADNKEFVRIGRASNSTFSHTLELITFKNCDYSSVYVFYHVEAYTGPLQHFKNIQFDNTNTLSGTSRLISAAAVSSFQNIYIQDSSTSNYPCVVGLTGGAGSEYYNIKIKCSGGYGVQLFDCRSLSSTSKLSNWQTSVTFYLADAVLAKFYNCVFDYSLNSTTYAIHRTDSKILTLNFFNCVFKGYSKVFYNREYGGSHTTTIVATNCIFDSNTQLLNNDDLGHQTANYCGYYNNGETYWARGANDFTSNPTFGNYNANAVIDPTFSTYALSNGYVATAAAYDKTGSDTYDNLSIDETVYSPDGYAKTGTSKVNPGVYYKFTTLVPSPVLNNLFHVLAFPF
jgi:hypothetical protein